MRGFSPTQKKTETITIRMDLHKLDQVDRVAAKFQLSRSNFINQCVDYALKNMAPPSE